MINNGIASDFSFACIIGINDIISDWEYSSVYVCVYKRITSICRESLKHCAGWPITPEMIAT